MHIVWPLAPQWKTKLRNTVQCYCTKIRVRLYNNKIGHLRILVTPLSIFTSSIVKILILTREHIKCFILKSCSLVDALLHLVTVNLRLRVRSSVEACLWELNGLGSPQKSYLFTERISLSDARPEDSQVQLFIEIF